MKPFFVFAIKLISISLLIVSAAQVSFAQDDDFFIEEPTDFEEPEDFDTPPTPDDEGFDGSPPGGFVPPPVRGGMGGVRNSGRLGGGRPSGGGPSVGGSSGAVEFYLVDPPRYWKKKARPPMAKPKAY